MKFIVLVRFRKRPTEEMIAQNLKWLEEESKEGIKVSEIYWTLGHYDAIAIADAPNEGAVMKATIKREDNMKLETLVAIPALEARKMV